MDTVIREPTGAGRAPAGGLEWRAEGDRLYLRISESEARRSAMLARGAAGVVAVLGAGLLWVTAWAWLLAAAGLAAAFAAPHFLRSEPLLLAEPEAGRLTPLKPELTPVPCAAVTEVRGAYETQGWDARSVICVVLPDGQERPVLILTGGDERRAEGACRLLGGLLGCPAVYTGAMGKPKRLG